MQTALGNIRTTGAEAGHGFSSAALEISVNLGLLSCHSTAGRTKGEREMGDRGCAEELIEVY